MVENCPQSSHNFKFYKVRKSRKHTTQNIRPIDTFGASRKEIEACHEARKQLEPERGRPGDFLPSSGMSSSPQRTEENKRSDEWLGSPSTKKRSWKVKGEIKPINFNGDDE
jgi:hypothetical protein